MLNRIPPKDFVKLVDDTITTPYVYYIELFNVIVVWDAPKLGSMKREAGELSKNHAQGKIKKNLPRNLFLSYMKSFKKNLRVIQVGKYIIFSEF